MMRFVALLLGTSMLAACGSGGGGGGVASGGSTAPVTGTTTPAAEHSFVNPTVEKTYRANGAGHSFQDGNEIIEESYADGSTNTTVIYSTELYAGDATTVRQSGFEVSYSPRDAIFNVKMAAPLGLISFDRRFQDPAHRTDFGGAVEPQPGTPRLAAPGIQYLETGGVTGAWRRPLTGGNGLPEFVATPEMTSGSYNVDTFFYQKPGTTTKYVTFAGFLRNSITASEEVTAGSPAVAATPTTPAVAEVPTTTRTKYNYNLQRGAFVFGEQTAAAQVPRSGTGTYNGTMIATAVLNDRIDDISLDAPTYFQWIEGAASARVDFGANIFNLDLTGTVFGPQYDNMNSDSYTVRNGASFNANGTGRIDLTFSGGFLGAFQRAWFVNPAAAGGRRIDLVIAGSSYDGTFYGPKAEEIGGNFRIVGGTPDERIDILGAFTGK